VSSGESWGWNRKRMRRLRWTAVAPMQSDLCMQKRTIEKNDGGVANLADQV
jgi:hypothetical protein